MTPEQRMNQIEKLGNQAFEHAMVASAASKLYEESLSLFVAATITADEKAMEQHRLAAHTAVDDILDSRHLIQKCVEEQKKLMRSL
jgi:hypothetical protein